MAILELEYKKDLEWCLLKDQFHVTYERLKPLNILKNTFQKVADSGSVKDSLIGTTAGLAAGYLSKALIIGATGNPVKKLLGVLLQTGVSNIVAKHPEKIRWLADNILKLLSRKKDTHSEISDEHTV